jgi:hypothetical protein
MHDPHTLPHFVEAQSLDVQQFVLCDLIAEISVKSKNSATTASPAIENDFRVSILRRRQRNGVWGSEHFASVGVN